MINIPIYRAKKIDSDEYIIGQYCVYKGYSTIFNEYGLNGVTIDPTTLAIHFPDMLDSQGSKIFASLSEDGKGGDMLKNDEYEFVAKYSDCGIILKSKSGELFMGAEYIEINNLKVTGIQK